MGVSFGAIKGDAHLIFMELSFEYPKLEYGNNPPAYGESFYFPFFVCLRVALVKVHVLRTFKNILK
jgi:hypothetical protein